MVCSYLSLFESASEVCSSRSLSLRAAPAAQKRPDSDVQYYAVTYGPIVPPECSGTFRDTVHSLYKIYKPPLPENVTLLHGQAPENGGENARPPPPEMLRAATPKVQVRTSQLTRMTAACCSMCILDYRISPVTLLEARNWA
jgi:hypothetical protein